ncbi:MAG: hypothetical protein QX196_11075 [Methylococcaceae bacterium]
MPVYSHARESFADSTVALDHFEVWATHVRRDSLKLSLAACPGLRG